MLTRRNFLKSSLAGLSLLLLGLAAKKSTSEPKIYYVAPDGKNSNDGLTPGKPITGKKAFDLTVNTGDIIQFSDGTYDL